METHLHDRPEAEALWTRIRATGLCTRPMGGVPLGVYLALHLCDQAHVEERRPQRTVTRRVLAEFDAYHDPELHLPGRMPKAPNIMKDMTAVPDWAGAIWTTARTSYRVDHGTGSLVDLDSPRHARIAANAAGYLREEMHRAGVAGARDLDVRFETEPHGRGMVDGVLMPLAGIVGGGPARMRRAARDAIEFVNIARSRSSLDAAEDMRRVIATAMDKGGVADMLVGVRPGAIRHAYANETSPQLSWFAVDLRGLGEDLLPRNWTIIAGPSKEIGTNATTVIRNERRNRRRLKTGPRIDSVLLAAIGEDGARAIYRETAAWMRGAQDAKARQAWKAFMERLPPQIRKVELQAGLLQAEVELAEGFHWGTGALTLGRTQMPQTMLPALQGMRLVDVASHPWLDPEAVVRTAVWVERLKGYVLRSRVREVSLQGANPAEGE